MHKEGRQILRKRVGEYVENLKLEFSKGMILPKKDNVKPDNIKNLTSGFNKKVNMQPVLSQVQIDNIKIDTSSIKIKEKFQCRAEDLYNALTKIEMVVAFTRGPAQLQAEKDGKFELFGGNIIGTFAELIPGQKIVQKWRYKQWPAGHFSKVTMKIEEKVKGINFELLNRFKSNDFRAIIQN